MNGLNNKNEPETEKNETIVSSSRINVNNISTLCHLNETPESIVNIDDLTKHITTSLSKLAPKKKSRKMSEPKTSNSSRKIYTCDICLAKIPKYRNLIPHMSSHINIHPIKLSCDICMITFPTENDFELHIIAKHDEIIIEKKTELCANEENLHECDVCGKKFAWDHQLQYHKNIHREAKQFSCDICSKKLPNIMTLRRHLQLHNISLYHCTICTTAKFQTIKELRQHRTKCGVMIDGKKAVCGNCGRKFRTTIGLNIHKSLNRCKNSGKYQYFCIKCGRKFLTRNGLNVHNVQSHK